MRLTQFTDYGLRVLMFLASHHEGYVTTEAISERFGISRDHLLKVVHRLAELGYVDAKRGPKGGSRLLPAAWNVSIGEVVRNLEPSFDIVECFDGRSNACVLTPSCGLAPLLGRATAAFLSELDQVRLHELVRQPPAHAGEPAGSAREERSPASPPATAP